MNPNRPEEKAEAGGRTEAEEPQEPDYVETFLAFSDRLEKPMRRLLAGLLAVLVAAQLLLQWEPARQLLVRVDRLEGYPYEAGRSGAALQ